MKLLSLFILAFAITSCCPSYSPNQQKVLNNNDSTIRFCIAEKPITQISSNKTTYYYYHKNGIHQNEGAIAGYPLVGDYFVFDFNNNLICKGSFKEGKKVGNWMRWNGKGQLLNSILYKNGKTAKTSYPTIGRPPKKTNKIDSKPDTVKHKWYQFYKKKKNAEKAS